MEEYVSGLRPRKRRTGWVEMGNGGVEGQELKWLDAGDESGTILRTTTADR